MPGPTRSHLARSVLAAATGALLLLGACTDPGEQQSTAPEPDPDPETTTAPAAPVAEGRQPDAPHTLVPSDDAEELAVATSRTYVDRAQVAVIAPSDDRDAVMRAASLGAATGAPVLLAEAESGELDTELLRLGVVGVVTVGAVDLGLVDTTGLAISPAPEEADELGDLFGTTLTEVELPAAADGTGDADALLALGDGEVFAAAADDDGGADAGESADETSATPVPEPSAVGELPPLAPPVQVEGAMLVADGAAEQVAAIGTARGMGVDVLRFAGDPRGAPDVIEAISAAEPSTVVGLGTRLGSDAEFGWRIATAATGTQLPGGGQLVFDDTRYVALYGSPITPALGILGEQGVSATIERAAELAGRYDDLTEDTVVPALEIIVTVATGSAGADGNYSNEWAPEEFVPLIEAAAEAGQYVVLDFQPGRASFPEQVEQYEELLRYPHVGIALDPEWRLGPDERPLQRIGSVDVTEVNEVVDYLADFVQEHSLPQKLIVLHQFQLRMITDRQDLDMSRTEVALLIHADGQGGQGAKQATWRALHEDAPEGVYWGWKNFIDEDSPMLTPEETYADVDPVPDFVSYQ